VCILFLVCVEIISVYHASISASTLETIFEPSCFLQSCSNDACCSGFVCQTDRHLDDWKCVSQDTHFERQRQQKQFEACLEEVQRDYEKALRALPERREPCKRTNYQDCCPDEVLVDENEVESANWYCERKDVRYVEVQSSIQRRECDKLRPRLLS
jgi:hypothetical protein